MQKIFAIGIPTLNRYDLLKEALEEYYIKFPNTEIYIIDNGNQDIDNSHSNIKLYNSVKNLGVAGSWNELCKLIFKKHSHALILNDDIIYSKTEKEVEEFINQNVYDFYVGPYYWSVFILPKETFIKTEGFDEMFYPAYFEDGDFHYRMKLLHLSYYPTEFLKPSIERNSMTIKKEPIINNSFENIKQWYIQKWGDLPGYEKYITPFNKSL